MTAPEESAPYVPPPVPEFFASIEALLAKGEKRTALDLVCEVLDESLIAGHFAHVDAVLAAVDAAFVARHMPAAASVVLGFLAFTCSGRDATGQQGKSALASRGFVARDALVKHVEAWLVAHKPTLVDAYMRGLR